MIKEVKANIWTVRVCVVQQITLLRRSFKNQEKKPLYVRLLQYNNYILPNQLQRSFSDTGDTVKFTLAPPSGQNVYFCLWSNVYKTKQMTISLSCTLCSVLTGKC